MPTVNLIRAHLFESIGKQYTDAEFDELCFEFGVEVDDIVTEMVEVGAEHALPRHIRTHRENWLYDLSVIILYLLSQFTGDGTKAEHVIYKIDIPANRYDLLCLEGIARAFRIFIGLESPPVLRKWECYNWLIGDLSLSVPSYILDLPIAISLCHCWCNLFH